MIKKQSFSASVIFFIIICLISFCNAQENRFTFTREKMGSPFDIILYDADSVHAVKIADEAFALVDSLVNIFSDYVDSSELNKLSNASGQKKYVAVTPALYDILLRSQKAHQLSNGAFDITIGPLVKLWRKARKEQQFPDTFSILKAKQLVGFYKLKIYPNSKSVKLMQPGMQLDLGGIAQGYIAEKVLHRLREHAIKRALINVSGDITMGDPPPGTKGWTIGINMPQRTEELQKKKLLLSNCSVSTSGDVYQYFEHNGKRYSHIIDPRTGYGITYQRNVTVIADDAATADWLATACCILALNKAKKLAKKMNVQLMIAEIQNGVVILHSSKHFKKYFK
jgi:thiamine biosynthesis lipoprotein